MPIATGEHGDLRISGGRFYLRLIMARTGVWSCAALIPWPTRLRGDHDCWHSEPVSREPVAARERRGVMPGGRS
jgi:hypothetical protein